MDDLGKALAAADVVIDFTSHDASARNAELCADKGVALVIGSTGFTAEAKARVAAAGRSVPVILSPNMSVGMNVLFDLVRQAAKVLGDAYDVEIVEIHHKRKRDAPSGTAVRLGEIAAEALGRDPADALAYTRHGILGERPPWQIGVQTLRGGDVVGEHTVFFCGEGERLELTHRATSREQFARGALRAARWLARQAGRHLRHGRRARAPEPRVRTCRYRSAGQERYGAVEGADVRPLSAAPWAGGLADGAPVAAHGGDAARAGRAVEGGLRRPELPRPREGARERGPAHAAPLPQAARRPSSARRRRSAAPSSRARSTTRRELGVVLGRTAHARHAPPRRARRCSATPA